jgi:preprotein translocase subunit SecE
MENNNSKILTLSFAIAGALMGMTVSLLIKSFAGAFAIVARLSDSEVTRQMLPAFVGIIVFALLQFNPRVRTWGDEVVAEIKKVVWPTQKDMTAMTIAVVVMVLISSVIVTGFDYFSGFIVTHLVQ